jgi:hypothetical protein
MLLGFLHGGYVSYIRLVTTSNLAKGLGALLSPLVATTVLSKGWVWYRFYVSVSHVEILADFAVPFGRIRYS